MPVCGTMEEIRAAADAEAAKLPPISQELADRVAAILARYRDTILAAREVRREPD
jgi:hypothetical protein